MSKNYHIKIGLSSIFFLLISLAFGQNDSLHLKRLSERKLTKKIIEYYCLYQNLTYKIDAQIKLSDKKYNLNISYRTIKDSAIWINVNHNSGIPVARFLITPDSTKMLNRIDKEYLLIKNSEVVDKLGYDISFDIVQSLFTAQLIQLENNKNIMQTYKHYKVYQDSTYYILQNIKKKKLKRIYKKEQIDEYLIHKVKVNSDFQIISTTIEDFINTQKIKVDYTLAKKEENCPQAIELFLTKNDKSIFMRLKIKKVKLNKDKLNLSFKIPKKYTNANLQK